jgi:aspartyl-tRNA(Asn)/glutamyl-tRNA(Gln) amidotransferase subunit B
MPEPDIPPVDLSDEYIQNIKENLKELPGEIRTKLSRLNIDKTVVEDILDRPPVTEQVLRILETSDAEHARRVSFWLLQQRVEDIAVYVGLVSRIADEQYIKVSKMVAENKLNSTAAKDVLDVLHIQGGDAEEIAEARNLLQVSDEGEIDKIVAEVLSENPKAAEDIKKGEMKAIGFLVGQVMKKSAGKANPQMAQQLIKKHLGIL